MLTSVGGIAANHERRASYGPNSPVVGERGARTRQAILDAALQSFQANGIHGTSVDDIAEAAGVSRAALYQYFESKEQLVVELIREAAGDLLRVIRRLGHLGPTAEGYDNLHWWLGEWAWVQDKYKALYLQWTVVDSPQASLRPLMAEYIVMYVSTLSPRLAASVDGGDMDVDGVATVLPALLFRVNDYRQKGNIRGLSEDELLEGLATFVQLALFPSTPAEALTVHAGSAPPDLAVAPSSSRSRRQNLSGRHSEAPLATDREQTPATVQRILDAGAETFADRGFHRTSVEDVLRAARAGRGTFYRYFDDKTDLLVRLARDCLVRLEELAGRFAGAVGATDEEHAATSLGRRVPRAAPAVPRGIPGPGPGGVARRRAQGASGAQRSHDPSRVRRCPGEHRPGPSLRRPCRLPDSPRAARAGPRLRLRNRPTTCPTSGSSRS